MLEDKILIKGNKEGINAVINFNSFKDFQEILEALVEKLSKGRKFYKGCTLKITTELKYLNDDNIRRLKHVLFEEFLIKDCIFEDKDDKASKVFSGVYEGRTKFIRRTVRGGQIVNYPGNIVIIGDVNPGAEVTAAGNVIVMGSLKGRVFAGKGGNDKAIIAAFALQPEIIQICDVVTRAPDDDVRPVYPELAKLKDNVIIVEPYIPNKFI